VRFLVFDAPAAEGGFEARLSAATGLLHKFRPAYARVHEHVPCSGIDHLRRELSRVEALGGEGLMLRKPESRYEAGRSATLLKVKTFHDAEARVVGHEAGRGRHKGRLGALVVEMADGTRFAVGTGLSDAVPALAFADSYTSGGLSHAPLPFRLYLDRTTGGHLHHRSPDRPVAARHPEGARGGGPQQVPEQSPITSGKMNEADARNGQGRRVG
jgi:DNA ligase-1